MSRTFRQFVIAPVQDRYNHLLQLDEYKSMGLKGVHPRVLKELADVIMGSPSIIFQQS